MDKDAVVLITGAGYSLNVGHPLTTDLLDLGIRLLLTHRQCDTRYSSVNEALRLLLEIRRVNRERHAAGKRELELEELIQALWDSHKDHLNKPDPLARMPEFLSNENPEYVRKHNYGWHERFGIDAGALTDGGRPKVLFDEFVWIIREILYWCTVGTTSEIVRKVDEIGSVAGIITTNYDIVPERCIQQSAFIDYGFAPDAMLTVTTGTYLEREREIVIDTEPRVAPDAVLPVIKLHGGVNLALCPACNRTLVFPLWEIGVREGGHAPTPGWYWAWHSSGYLQTVFHNCQEIPNDQTQRLKMSLRPLMAPPMTNKHDLDHWLVLKELQNSATNVIDRCNRVAIIGSALRASDSQLLGLVERLQDKDVVLYGLERDHTRLRTHLPRAKIDFRGPFLESRTADLDKAPGTPWGAAPSLEYGEDNPTDEFLKRRETFLTMMTDLKRKAGVLPT